MIKHLVIMNNKVLYFLVFAFLISSAFAGVWRKRDFAGDQLKEIEPYTAFGYVDKTGSVTFVNNSPDIMLECEKYSFFDTKSVFVNDTLFYTTEVTIGFYDNNDNSLVKSWKITALVSSDGHDVAGLGYLRLKKDVDIREIHEAIASGKYNVRFLAHRYGKSSLDITVTHNAEFENIDYLESNIKKLEQERERVKAQLEKAKADEAKRQHNEKINSEIDKAEKELKNFENRKEKLKTDIKKAKEKGYNGAAKKRQAELKELNKIINSKKELLEDLKKQIVTD